MLKINVKAEIDETNPYYQLGAVKAQMAGFASNLNRILNFNRPDEFKLKVIKITVEKFIQELEAQNIKVTPPSAYIPLSDDIG